MEAKLSDGNGTVSVTNLHVPLVFLISLLAVFAGGAASVVGVWYKAASHMEENTIHVDQQRAMDGGGVAYKADVSRAAAEQEAKTRTLLRTMTIRCRKDKEHEGGFTCGVELP